MQGSEEWLTTKRGIMDFVTFDIAKKLKEKGFPQEKKDSLAMYDVVGGWYSLARNLDEFDEYLFEDFDDHDCVCPTISQVLKWFRDVNIYCLPWFEQGVDMWFYAICKPACGSEFPEFLSESDYDTYEQAALAGIEYVLDNLI